MKKVKLNHLFNPQKTILTGLLLTLFANSTAMAKSVNTSNFSHASFDTLLKKYVVNKKTGVNLGQETQVDYAGIQKNPALLNQYLQATSQVKQAQFNAWSKQAQLAFLINVYNAQTIKLVLTKYPNIKSIKDIGSLFQSPWKKKFIPLLGKTRSLDDIEHKMIRSKTYADPRIHFAVNCASIGCPALRSEAYTGTKINRQLEDATIKFLSDRSRNYVKNDTLYVSSIFKWYGKDFKKGWQGYHHLNQFFGQYAKPLGLNKTQITKLKQDNLTIKYLPYNWQLNKK